MPKVVVINAAILDENSASCTIILASSYETKRLN